MKGRILVVEDNLITAEVISRKLRKLGYEIAGVLTSGEEAVAWVGPHEADLILMDVQLEGEMDGVEAVKSIRLRSEVPIVYLTANADGNTISRASDTRVSGYLPKPLDERTLHTTIQMALGRRNADVVAAETRDRLARTLEALPAAVIAIDTAGTVTSMNNLAAILTGWRMEAAVGQDIAYVLQATDVNGRNVTHEIPGLFLSADLAPVRQDVRVISAAGEHRAMGQIASPIVDETQRLIGIILEFRGLPQDSSAVME